MNRYVVDTNVGIVAHQKSPNIDPRCISKCVAILEESPIHNVIVVDDKYLILGEYHNVIRNSRERPVSSTHSSST